MREVNLFLFLFISTISVASVKSEVEGFEKKYVKVCSYCTCSEIPNEDGTHLVLNIQCSELDKIVNLPDLDKIEWPENPNGLKISATFEGLGLSVLGKLPPNSQVETLRFSNNALKTYWPDPFSDVPNLKRVSFAQNDLTELTPDLFTNIPLLEDVDFSYNKLTGFNVMDFKNLHNVKRLNLQSNGLKKIPLEAFQPMTALEDLDLSKNGIFDLLLQRTGEELAGLRRLSLNGNRLRSVMRDAFPSNNSLELLDLSNNMIENVEEDSFLTCTSLKELNIGQNNITFVFSLPPSLQIAIFKQNTLHRWPMFPPGITYIDLSYNKLTEVYDEDKVDFDNLEVLNIGGNQIKYININKKLPKLFSLDISYNQIEEIPSSLNSQNFPSLEELRLDGNPILTVYFKNIISVKSLYMNELNLLTVVEDKAFSNVVGKRSGDGSESGCFTLFLSNCHTLSEIKEGAFAGTSVCMLDISNNNLTTLPEALLNWSSVAEGVNLQWNPWDCSCHLQWVLDTLLPMLYRSHSMLLDQLRCQSPRGVSGLRLVHWYNWTERVLCDHQYSGYLLEASSGRDKDPFSNPSSLTLILGGCIIVCLLVAIALSVYLIRGRKRYRVRQAALKRKRQSAIDARNSSGQQKEQYSALNKV